MSDTEVKDNVKRLPLKGAKKAKSETPKKAEIWMDYSRAMEKRDWRGPIFPNCFKSVLVNSSCKLILEFNETTDEARYVDSDAVINAIVTFGEQCMPKTDMHLSYEQASSCAKYFIARSKPVAMPKLVRFLNEPGTCFRRLPFDFNPNASLESAPLFKELIGRISNSEALVRFLGSLFIDEADLQQYLWLHGEGSDGKSSITRLLHKAFGDEDQNNNSYRSLFPPSGLGGYDKFWTYSLLGCRVGVFPDCNATGFVTGGFFKTLTGNDAVSVEAKGKLSTTAKLRAKYIFLSNQRPDISSQTADVRRLIYCEVAPPPGSPDGQYDEKLWKEAQTIISFCVQQYHLFAQKNGHVVIPVDKESLDDLTTDNEERFEAALRDGFEIVGPENKDDFCRPVEFTNYVQMRFSGNKVDINNFKNYLRRKHGVRSCAVRYSYGVEKRYINLKKVLFNCLKELSR